MGGCRNVSTLDIAGWIIKKAERQHRVMCTSLWTSWGRKMNKYINFMCVHACVRVCVACMHASRQARERRATESKLHRGGWKRAVIFNIKRETSEKLFNSSTSSGLFRAGRRWHERSSLPSPKHKLPPQVGGGGEGDSLWHPIIITFCRPLTAALKRRAHLFTRLVLLSSALNADFCVRRDQH